MYLIPRVASVLPQTPEGVVCEEGQCAITFHPLQSQGEVGPVLRRVHTKGNLQKKKVYC